MEALKLEKQHSNIIMLPSSIVKKPEPQEYSEFKSNNVLKARSMESIRSYDDFVAMQNYFLERGKIRDWTMWTAGISFGLRICDLLKIRFGWILNDDKTFRVRLTISENKTHKLNNFLLTESIIFALTKYFDSLDWNFDLNDYIFTSQKKCKLTGKSAWRILSEAAKKVLQGVVIGPHSMRKSHANIIACFMKTTIDVHALTAAQLTLNHSDFKTTMHYLGVINDLKEKGRAIVSEFVLGRTENELTIGAGVTLEDLLTEIQKITK